MLIAKGRNGTLSVFTTQTTYFPKTKWAMVRVSSKKKGKGAPVLVIGPAREILDYFKVVVNHLEHVVGTGAVQNKMVDSSFRQD